MIIIITEQSALLVCSDLPKYMQHNYNNDYSPVLKMSASATSIRSTGSTPLKNLSKMITPSVQRFS